MIEEQMLKARYYAACDIAHRWFAFFEGDTERVEEHCEIFSEDVMLVHAGKFLLAQGKTEINQWLRNLPYEKGSHFICAIDVIPITDNQAEVNMDISYQMIDSDMRVGGALSEYRTRVKFDEQHNAEFTFIQKTPLSPNPNKVYKDSFAINRLHSFIARFSQLTITNPSGISELLAEDFDAKHLLNFCGFLQGYENNRIKLLSFDPELLSCNLLISSVGKQHIIELTLTESPGRYMTIRSANISELPATKS